jgi:hypothetical protein
VKQEKLGEKCSNKFCLRSVSFIFVGFFNMLETFRHGNDSVTSSAKEFVLRTFIALKNPSSSAGFEPAILWLTISQILLRLCFCEKAFSFRAKSHCCLLDVTFLLHCCGNERDWVTDKEYSVFPHRAKFTVKTL